MTDPPCTVILTLPSGGQHAVCPPEAIREQQREQRSYSTYAGTPALLELVQLVQRAIPGAEVTSPAQARAETEAIARARGVTYDQHGRCLVPLSEIRKHSAEPAPAPEPRRAAGRRASR